MYAELKQAWQELTGPGQLFEVTTAEVGGVSVRSYAHAPPSLREIWLGAAGHGDKEYLVYNEERLSYADAQVITGSIAHWLAEAGVGPGDRVAIAMRNYPEWMLAYWALTAMGAVVVGMNAWWVPQELHYGLEDSTPRVLIADQERLQRFTELRSDFPDLIVVGVRVPHDLPDWATDWAELVNSESRLPEVTIAPDDDACIFYTSGTTGRPKGAQLTHRGCVNNIFNVAFANAVQPRALALARGEAPAEPGSSEIRALVATPLFHVTANNCVAQVVTLVGGRLVHMYKWDPAEALRLIEREQVTTFNAVPMMAREIMMHPDFTARDTSSLKSVGGGGAAMQPDLVGKVSETIRTARPNTGYGMTETSGIITAVSMEFFMDRPTSVGPAMPTFEARIVDPVGKELPVGDIGELVVRGAPVIKGYLNRPEATAETIVDGWLHTGDVAYMDEDGFIYLVDRAKDMVLRGGENVYCAEVENALFHHEAVAECVAFAVPDDRLGEEVGAAVHLKSGASVDAEVLRSHCRQHLAAFKVPRYLWFLDEPLPRNANGKFLKRELREALKVEDAA
ncbi:class I adenylate-forming enzyme family protein [Pseudohaliea rubra]|uniref:Long-chain-fatty-acid--CoA ligase n=1 Tax=Pseudohaliea rubra DSM 19751 TaxID=1265313 RepID=A0A095XYQ2_9GAMM|nr:AMP-binding protein [Pseudohaliea rubra]KGE04896.1 Long-chain-fatty-acid--CoA ligase [Pseudohaliea rubra DSM 19751]